MTTGPSSAIEAGAGASSTGAAACAITRPATPIALSIFGDDTAAAAGLPQRLQIEDPAGELWFKADGQAVYQPDADGPSVVSFRYVADYPTGSADPATAYVLVNGSKPLPEDALNDPALTAACSRAAALEIAVAQPGAPVQPPAPGVRVEVQVDAFAGAEIALIDAEFKPWIAKYFLVDGGVAVFLDDGRVVFLAGADRTDLPQLPAYLLPHPRGFPSHWDAADLLAHAKGIGDTQIAPPPRHAELAADHVAFLAPLPAGLNPVEAVARTELPFCGAEARCEVYEYQDSAYIPVSGTLAAGLGSAAGELGWFAPGSAPLVVLAAAGPLDAPLPTAASADLAAYWLERDPGLSVVRIDGFFGGTARPDPPDLSIGESRFVDADALLQVAQPVMLPGFESAEPVLRIPPSAFHSRLEHGGGAGFSILDGSNIGEGLVPLLEQPPTERPQGEDRDITRPPPPVGGNREPVANDDLAATFNDQPIVLRPLVNDFDPDPNDVIRVAGVRGLLEAPAPDVAAAAGLRGLELVGGASGGRVETTGQTIRYVPDPDFEGTATIRYVIADDRGGVSAPATISVAVVDRVGNEPPVAVDDAAVTPVDQPVVIDVRANDFDPDLMPNSLLPGRGLPLAIERIEVRPEHGTLERVGGGGEQQLRYTPEAGFTGLDRFSYTVTDGLSPSDPGVVTIRVGPEPPPPEAVDDEVLAQAGGAAITIDVLANDTGTDLTIVALGEALLGEAVIDGDRVLYRPPGLDDLSAPGRIADEFSYAIEDGRGGEDSASVRVDLNRAPQAVDDLVQIEGRTLAIDVLGNDGDLDGDALTIVALGPPEEPGAEVAISDDGRQILYTRPADLDGEQPFDDVFDYTVDDGRGGVASATVRLFEGPDVPPTLTVEPATVEVVIADDFAFPTTALFPTLSEGRALETVTAVDPGDLSLDVSRTVTVSFVSEDAGFANSLGFYTLANGVPTAPELIFPRVEDGVVGSEPVVLGRFPATLELGLFLVQDAADLLEGATELAFRPGADGRQELVRIDGGVERVVDAPVLFTDSTLNGGAVQAIAGRPDGDAASLQIGFEDRVVGGGADGDYNDALFQVSYGHVASGGLDFATTIDDPDSATMSLATVTIANGAAGDRLLLDGIDPGDPLRDGITVTGENTARLSLTGAASADDYERLLEAVALEVDELGDARELEFRVFDDSSPDALPSNVARVTVEPVPLSTSAADHGSLLASLTVPDQAAA